MIAIAPASSMCRSKSFHCSWIDLLSGGGLLTTFTAVAASLARTRARCFQAPLIGDTIGVYFDKSVACWSDRPALIVRQQNVRRGGGMTSGSTLAILERKTTMRGSGARIVITAVLAASPFPQSLQKSGNFNREAHRLRRFRDHQSACSAYMRVSPTPRLNPCNSGRGHLRRA